jgi:hypothetical protein
MRDDGYINATMICKAGNKKFNHYKENKQTEAYLQALETITGIPVIKLIQSIPGKYGGTYVH